MSSYPAADPASLEQLKEMGFPPMVAENGLRMTNNNLEAAVTWYEVSMRREAAFDARGRVC